MVFNAADGSRTLAFTYSNNGYGGQWSRLMLLTSEDPPVAGYFFFSIGSSTSTSGTYLVKFSADSFNPTPLWAKTSTSSTTRSFGL
jgi:hypothetical protein